jgi:predicted permease
VILIDELMQDLRHAVRTLRRMPGFAIPAVLILALGIGVSAVMFTLIHAVLLKPLSYPEPERLVTLHGTTNAREAWGFSYPDFLDVTASSRTVTMAGWTYGGGTVTAPGEAAYVDGRQISSELFSVLGVRVAEGRAFRPDEDRPGALPVAIVSYAVRQQRYGGRSPVGQAIVFEGRPHTIVGVAPAGFQLQGETDVFTPLGQNVERRMQNREARFIHVLGRLGAGATLDAARAELAVVSRRLAAEFPASNAGRDLVARPLQAEIVGDIGGTLWLLLGAVGVVLIIACVNVASLVLARAVARERELVTRVALGASRGRVARYCLAESAVLGVVGGAIGIALAAAGLEPFVALWPDGLPRADEIRLDWQVALVMFAVALTCGVAIGLAPALRVPMSGLEASLRAGGRTIARSSRRLHGTFVVLELALAVVLLVCAGMLSRTLLALSSLDPGLDTHNVVTAHVALSPGVLNDPARIRASWDEVVDRARRLPGVESVALTDIVPMRVGENALPYSVVPGQAPSSATPVALASTVTPDYLTVMGIPLRAGRFFDGHDRADSERVVVIDETLARRAFGQINVVGRALWVAALGPSPIRIIGVVGHVRHWGLATDDRATIRDQMYYPFAQVPAPLLRLFSSFMSIAVRTTVAPLDVVEPLRATLRATSGEQTLYEVRTLEQLARSSVARQRFLVVLFSVFGGAALLLACVGIYGVPDEPAHGGNRRADGARRHQGRGRSAGPSAERRARHRWRGLGGRRCLGGSTRARPPGRRDATVGSGDARGDDYDSRRRGVGGQLHSGQTRRAGRSDDGAPPGLARLPLVRSVRL